MALTVLLTRVLSPCCARSESNAQRRRLVKEIKQFIAERQKMNTGCVTTRVAVSPCAQRR